MASEYEQRRLERLRANREHMVGLGLFQSVESIQQQQQQEQLEASESSAVSKETAQELALKKKQRLADAQAAAALLARERPRRNVPIVSFKPPPRNAKQVKAAKTEEEIALEEASRRRSVRIRARPAISFAEFESTIEYDEDDVPRKRVVQEDEEEEDEATAE